LQASRLCIVSGIRGEIGAAFERNAAVVGAHLATMAEKGLNVDGFRIFWHFRDFSRAIIV